MILGENDMDKLIPHREPMIMIDSLLSYDEQRTVTGFTIKSNNIFLEEGRFSAYGMVENIAQTAAAGSGYYYFINKLQVPMGFIGAITKLQILNYASVGDNLTTEVSIIATLEQISIVKATCMLNDKVLVRCEMKMFTDGEAPVK